MTEEKKMPLPFGPMLVLNTVLSPSDVQAVSQFMAEMHARVAELGIELAVVRGERADALARLEHARNVLRTYKGPEVLTVDLVRLALGG
jgi:hypothetical protein